MNERNLRITYAVQFVAAIVLVLVSSTAAFAATVTASWNANPEPSVTGYVLSYGTSSGSYTTNTDVGNVIGRQLTLNPGRYYFAVRAYNASSQMSPYSTEIMFDVPSSPAVPALTSLSPTSGSTGTTVTVNGSNFGASQGSSTVRFNGATATVSSWTASQIVATVPSGATSGNVVVTVGGVASNGLNFSVTAPPPPGLPSPWTSQNIGSPALIGTATHSSGTFTISGAGIDIWNSNDQFNFVYQPLNGNGEIVARVGSIGSTDVLAKAGVMIRENLTGGARHVMSLVTSGMGMSVQRREITGGSATADQGFAGTAPQWLRLVRNGNTFTGYYSATGSTWTLMDTVTVTMTAQVYIGLAATSHNPVSLTTATFSNVTVTSGSPPPPAPTPTITSLSPASGLVGTSVTISGTNFGSTQGTSTVRFNGTTATPTSWSASSIVAPVPAGATSGSVTVTVNGTASNGSTFTVTTPPPPAPVITSLSPTSGVVGTSVTIAGSNFGSTQGSSTVRFNGVTAAVTSWNSTSIVAPVPAGATSGNVVVTVGGVASGGWTFSVTTPAGLPSPWTSQNIGSPSLAGTASHSSGTFTISGAGSDIWNSSDQFNFVYQPLNGNGEIIARVDSLGSTDLWAKAGVMIREDLTGGARHVMSLVSAGSGVSFQSRATPGAAATGNYGIAGAPPQWVRLVRTGNTFSGYYSSTGSSWTSLGTVNVAMAAQVYVGLAVTSHNPAAVTTATIGSVSLTGGSSPPASPSITSLSPTSGLVGTSVTISGANFGSSQGTSTVRFNGTTATPTSWSASSIAAPVPAGATSGSVTVTVNGAASNGSTFTVTTAPPPAPVITSLSPTSGAVGTSVTISGTNFGSTQGTSTVRFNGVTAAPSNWNSTSIVASVPSGATSGTVVVTVGGVASSGVNFTVTVPSGLPAPWTSQNIGSPALNGTASHSSGTFTVSGGGTDIWNTSDQFNFVYQPLNGNGEIIARINSVGNTDVWAKAGVMIRENLTGGARHAMALVTAGSGLSFQRRATPDAAATGNYGIAGAPPRWVRLVRTGNSFAAYYSSTGSSWTSLGTADIPMTAQVYVGLAVTSHNPGAITTAAMSNVTVTGGVSGSLMTLSTGDLSAVPLLDASVEKGADSAVLEPEGGSEPARAPTGSDYDGDGRADPATYRPSTGRWRVLTADSNYTDGLVRAWGTSSDVRVPGDYDGDGKTDLAYYRPSTGSWSILTSSSGLTQMLELVIGGGLETPVPADYDGDGATDVAVYDSKTGQWHALLSSAGFGAEVLRNWGSGSDVPVPGDYDGDGKADPAIYSPATGEWKVMQSANDYAATVSVKLGSAGDVPVPADFDGDGTTDAAVFRPSTAEWRILRSTDRTTTSIKAAASGTPVALDFDGDGKADLALFQGGIWRVQLSSVDYAPALSIDAQGNQDVPLPTRP